MTEFLVCFDDLSQEDDELDVAPLPVDELRLFAAPSQQLLVLQVSCNSHYCHSSLSSHRPSSFTDIQAAEHSLLMNCT